MKVTPKRRNARVVRFFSTLNKMKISRKYSYLHPTDIRIMNFRESMVLKVKLFKAKIKKYKSEIWQFSFIIFVLNSQNAIEIMNTVMRQWQYRQDFLKLCTTITKQIISKSNMKRPVMRAATFLQSICNRAVKFPAFFDEIVEESLDEALHANPEYQKIRKTPESRLILHSIAKAGTSKGRVYWCAKL